MNLAIFTEAFSARLFPAFHETTLNAIKHFKMDEYPENAVLAGIGALLASLILFFIGIWLRRMPERISTPEQQGRIETLRLHAHFWLPYLLVLSPTPVGGVLIIAAGFFRMKPALAAAVIVAAEVLWRAMPYLR